MRGMIIGLVLATAAPAAAQTSFSDLLRLDALQAQADLARQRSVSQENQLMALDAQLRTELALREIRAQQARPTLPQPDPDSPSWLDTSKLAVIPDAALAASNAAVRAASQPRR